MTELDPWLIEPQVHFEPNHTFYSVGRHTHKTLIFEHLEIITSTLKSKICEKRQNFGGNNHGRAKLALVFSNGSNFISVFYCLYLYWNPDKVTTFFAFVVISYVRESKLVFLVEKYSNQLENLQNYTAPNDAQQSTQKFDQMVQKSPKVKIYKIPAHLPEDRVIDFPDLQDMIENHYNEYEGKD